MFSIVLCLVAAAGDVAVVELGASEVGSADRVTAVRAAVMTVDPTAKLIADADARALVEEYGRGCVVADGVCWARAAAASGVAVLVLVPATGPLVFVDVADSTPRALEAAEPELAVERGLFRERFGHLVVEGAPAAAVVLVDGQPLPADGIVRAGAHRVHIEAPGYAARELEISVAGDADVVVNGSLLAPGPAGGDLLWAWPAASTGVAVVALLIAGGLEVHLANEQLRASKGDNIDVVGFNSLGGVELGAFVVAGVAAASAIVGAVVVFRAPEDIVTAP
ncbi:MAG: hypothetical protein Q8O67_18925 [Deltaproteobacteria bacterium]|nr:hypothetical protein [Deltaproteobacteria bacterium]